jgi:hypothetical protein
LLAAAGWLAASAVTSIENIGVNWRLELIGISLNLQYTHTPHGVEQLARAEHLASCADRASRTARIAAKDRLPRGSIVAVPLDLHLAGWKPAPLLISTVKSLPNHSSSLGFLTVVEHAELGLLGGYLLLNAAGRPLEFHCTAPVKPSRAQEILYGPTLRPFVYGEQIGQTLLTRSKLTPLLVCTDSEPMLAVRDHTHIPVALVSAGGRESLAEFDSPSRRPSPAKDSRPLQLGHNELLLLPAAYAADEQTIRDHWPAQADHLDLAEPFARIREALDEAQKTARAA